MSHALGKVLREARKHLSLSQQKVATRVEVSRAAVGQWESGASEPSTHNLIRLCDALGIDLEHATRGELKHIEGFKAVEVRNQEGLPARTIEQANFMDKHPFNQRDYFINRNLMPFYASHDIEGDSNVYFTEEPLFFAPRAADAPNDNEAYILGIMNDRLSPQINRMSMVYVDGKTIPTLGDLVLVKLNHLYKHQAEATLKSHGMQRGVLGRLENFAAGSITIRQFNPVSLREIALDSILAIHRIIPTDAK